MAETIYLKDIFKVNQYNKGMLNNFLKSVGYDLDTPVTDAVLGKIQAKFNTNVDILNSNDDFYNLYRDFRERPKTNTLGEFLTQKDVSLDNLASELAKYNKDNKTSYTTKEAMDAVETQRIIDYEKVVPVKEELESIAKKYSPEALKEQQGRAEYEASPEHKLMRGGSYVVDAVGGLPPGVLGYLGSAVGPGMRLVDNKILTGEYDLGNALQDLLTNEAGQALGGGISLGSAKIVDGFAKRPTVLGQTLNEAAKIARDNKRSWYKINPDEAGNVLLTDLEKKIGTPEFDKAAQDTFNWFTKNGNEEGRQKVLKMVNKHNFTPPTPSPEDVARMAEDAQQQALGEAKYKARTLKEREIDNLGNKKGWNEATKGSILDVEVPKAEAKAEKDFLGTQYNNSHIDFTKGKPSFLAKTGVKKGIATADDVITKVSLDSRNYLLGSKGDEQRKKYDEERNEIERELKGKGKAYEEAIKALNAKYGRYGLSFDSESLTSKEYQDWKKLIKAIQDGKELLESK